MTKLRSNRWGVLSVFGSVLLVGAAVAVSQQQQPISQPGIQHAEELSVTFRDVASNVLPAVVSIETQTKAVQISNDDQNRRSPQQEEFFKRFFGENLPPGFEDNFRQRRSPQQRGAGSGFIIDGKGVILTNAHVVQGASRVTVTLHDGREIEAAEWHADPRSDVAIVKLETDEELPNVPLGDSSQMEIGDWVLALGNPFDIGTTVTSGIISAKGRNAGINEVESYLQTDAAINPGNSGGPLVNLRGEVIGINTAISTRSGGYDGVGFAIPIDTAHWVADQLVATGGVQRAYLGVVLQPMDATLREQFGVGFGEGTLVSEVRDGSPASAAGVEEGDVIVELNGQQVRNSSHLVAIVERLPVDKPYSLTVLRNGKRQKLDVTLKTMPSDYTPALKRAMSQNTAPSARKEYNALGLEVVGLDSAEARQLSLADDLHGVLVTSVEPESPADAAGLETGDVIQKVGSQKLMSAEDFTKAASELSLDDGIALLVNRNGNSRFVVLRSQR